MKIRYIVVLLAVLFLVGRLGWLSILVVKKQIETRDTGEVQTLSPTEILIVRAKTDDSDCSLSLAVASKDATDQDFINLLPKVQNDFRHAVAYIFDSKESAVYPKTAHGGFVDRKNTSHIVGQITCNLNGYQEVIRYKPNMWEGKPRVLFHRPSGN
jgi:hypothetical protein